MRYVKACGLGLVGGLGLMLASQATASTTLDKVGTLTVGGLEFFDFSYSSATLDASQVSVDVITTASGNPGLVFNAGWNTTASPVMDSVIDYKVRPVAGSGTVVTGGGLDIRDYSITGDATVSVGESITDNTNGKDYSMQVLHGAGFSIDSDSITINPSSSALTVSKDITLAKPMGSSDYAAVSWVDNTFTTSGGSGSTPPIPEPMTLALIPLGLAGLGLRKKLAR